VAFHVLETQTKASMPPRATISYMRRQWKESKRPRARDEVLPALLITVPTVLITSKAKTFQLLIGNGDHAGKLRLRGLGKGAGIEPHELKHCLRFNFGYVPSFAKDGEDEIFGAQRCKVTKISEDEYEIDTPFLGPAMGMAT
jgi:hypothetical protein